MFQGWLPWACTCANDWRRGRGEIKRLNTNKHGRNDVNRLADLPYRSRALTALQSLNDVPGTISQVIIHSQSATEPTWTIFRQHSLYYFICLPVNKYSSVVGTTVVPTIASCIHFTRVTPENHIRHAAHLAYLITGWPFIWQFVAFCGWTFLSLMHFLYDLMIVTFDLLTRRI